MKKQIILSQVFREENSSGVALKNKTLKKLIFNFLDKTDRSSITELSKELNISVPKTTSLVNELMDENLISDYGKIDSTGGRKASMYGLVPDACFFLGVDVKKYYVNIGLMNFKKHLVTQKNRIPFRLENTPGSLSQLINLIQGFIKEAPVKKEKILSMGINLSGRINHTIGYSYSFFHFQEEPLSSYIEGKTGIKTYLENDSRAMAYGEFMCGEVTNEKNVLFVNMDYGIGLGVLIDGKIYYGKSGFSGELGHIPFFDNELICHCGKKGCLETEASGTALIRRFKERLEQGSSSSVELIILGGTLSETGDYLRLPARSAINKFSLSLVNTDTQLKLSQLGEKAGIWGACLLARNKVLTVL